MTPDCELLRRYAEANSEEAFAELVQRHLDFVYSAAFRQVNGDAHLAQDVAQTVFSDLARKAAALSRRQVLTGWLYTSTHFTAAKAVRTERRRHTHEQEAQAMQELLHTPTSGVDWEKLRPVLDNVMHELKESDRELILMRYFENRQLADIGEKIGVGEDAARKRIDRALEKLRAFLSKRGITTTATLATVLSANAVQMAPTGLAATLTGASLAGAAAGTGATLTVLKLMSMTKLQAGMIGAVIVAGVATPLVIQHQTKLREENQSLRRQIEQLAQAANERADSSVPAAGPQTLPDDQLRDLLRLRNEVGQLRRQTNAVAQLQEENRRLRVAVSAGQNSQAPFNNTSQPLVPKESWAFAGYATPETALQSLLWAQNKGDLASLLAGVHPELTQTVVTRMEGKTEHEIAAGLTNLVGAIPAFRILNVNTLPDGKAQVGVGYFDDKTGKGFGKELVTMQNVGGEWRVIQVLRSPGPMWRSLFGEPTSTQAPAGQSSGRN